ncbi:6-phosphogluconolactonase [Nocardia bhagyanarayanae]|uniref:6-phosphogluconolactonase n=2 Tax=Nocardia bhagyanarayanae TaxID=1215925 RepID=A0A543FFA7_9NOCA|nr:6-phosphogluconolactonase [Nocardia bhagyanarayanae]
MALAAAMLPGLAVVPHAAAEDAGYFIYAHGFLSNGIAGYRASDTGAPAPISGSADTGVPNWPQAATPDGRFLFVAPTTERRLLTYAIGPDGELTAGATLALPDVPIDIAFAPNGRDAYVVTGLTNAKVVALSIGADGVPVPNGPAVPFGQAMDGVSTVAVAPDGASLLVTSLFARQLLNFDIHPDGTVSAPRQRLGTGMNPIFATITPDGRSVYVINELTADVSAYHRASDGALTEMAGSPYPAGLLPHVPSITPDGRYLYVPNMGSSFISSYRIESDGSLTALPNADFAPDKPGTFAESSVMSPSGRTLWALGTDPARGGEEILRRFAIGADGVLDLDESMTIYTRKFVADGRTMTLVPRR